MLIYMYIRFTSTIVMCILVVICTNICTYLSILPLNSFDDFANIDISTGYLNNYILHFRYNFYLGCKQISIHAFLSYDSNGWIWILIILSTYIGRYHWIYLFQKIKYHVEKVPQFKYIINQISSRNVNVSIRN